MSGGTVESILAFLSMGGYAAFVWPSFAVTLSVLFALAVVTRQVLKANEETLRALRQGETSAGVDQGGSGEA